MGEGLPETSGRPPAVAVGSRIAGYLLEEETGAGGMAVVFRALDERLNRPVALKVLAPGLAADEDFRQRFLQESRAAAAVDDPHILPVYEAGEAARGVLFISMRYVSGGDVRGLLRRVGSLPPARAAAIISSVASALDAAHASGLVHRDVKPANMLVDTRPGRPDHVYLSDFGLSKIRSSSVRLTQAGLYLGTVGYMAPEQIEGREVDGRADQYALACAAFELLSGAVPFERDQDLAVIYAHLSQPPPSLTSRCPGLPARCDAVLSRALAKAPSDRYSSCRDFAEALRQALGLPGYADDAGLAASRSEAPRSDAAGSDAAGLAPVTAGRDLPAGVVTFLSSDIEGSTALLSRLGEQYGEALSAHRDIVRAAIKDHRGLELGTEGDSFFVVFSSAPEAVRCGAAAQRALAAHQWPGGAPLRVRMGLHSGEPTRHGDTYIGMDLHRAARIAAAAHGGQVVLSQSTWRLAEPEIGPEIGVRDLGFHRLKDIEAPERIYQLTGPGLATQFPPLNSLGGPPTVRGLAPALSTFVGRAEAVDEICGLLDGCRLVTVTGPGGVGKTRLATEVARRLAARFADGACLVELAAVSDPALLPAAVAAALGIPQAPDLSAAESLTAALARLRILLVLDNCEHIIGAAADLCETALAAGDDARILATSREPLRVAGEARYRLPPLSLPQSGEHAGDQAGPDESEAVHLFADRAKRVDPHFTLDSGSAPVVARLVARLDGMPLAIELAAAWVEALGVEQLLERLDDRFALLAGGDRRAAARQRSLAATVDWSYQLLNEAEQRVFRQLAAVPGPFTLDAARELAGSGAEAAVLRLVDCSLISPPRPGPDGRARYLMLETLRAYGTDRLATAGEQQAVAGRLATYALRLASAAADGMRTSAGELAAARWLDAEAATTQQVLTWALEHDPGQALRLAVNLAPWWLMRGRGTAGYPLLLAAAEGTGSAEGTGPAGGTGPAEGAWAAAQYWLGYFANLTGDPLGALQHYARAISAVADDPRSPVLADAISGRATCLINLRRTAEAAEEAHQALDLAREIRYPAGEARALHDLSVAAQYGGDDAKALEWARQAAGLDPRAIPGGLVRQCNQSLASILVDAGDLAAAEASCVTELGRARQVGDLHSESFCLDLLAELDERQGRIADAAAHLRQALDIATRIGSRLRVIGCLDTCGHLCAATGRWAEAVTMWAAFITCLKELGMPDLPAARQRRRAPLHRARQALGREQARAAEERGGEMTLATAVELAILLAGADTRTPADAADLGALNAKERELIVLVAQGRSDADISGRLGVSVRTVRSRVNRIRTKANCPRRTDLIRLALQAGLV